VTYVPTISRPADPRNAGWTGRTGRAEHVVHDVCRDLHLRPDRTVVYICGNPDMILNAESVLMDDGFPEFHVKKELYWPKGKRRRPKPADSLAPSAARERDGGLVVRPDRRRPSRGTPSSSSTIGSSSARAAAS
jgi:hypothetical protein